MTCSNRSARISPVRMRALVGLWRRLLHLLLQPLTLFRAVDVHELGGNGSAVILASLCGEVAFGYGRREGLRREVLARADQGSPADIPSAGRCRIPSRAGRGQPRALPSRWKFHVVSWWPFRSSDPFVLCARCGAMPDGFQHTRQAAGDICRTPRTALQSMLDLPCMR